MKIVTRNVVSLDFPSHLEAIILTQTITDRLKTSLNAANHLLPTKMVSMPFCRTFLSVGHFWVAFRVHEKNKNN